MAKTAEDLMDEPDFIDVDTDIDEVAEEVKGGENTLIVKENGKAIGEIHEQSLLKILIPEDRLDEEKVIGILGMSFDSTYVADKAEDVMNRHEVSVTPDEEIGEIAFVMDREDIRAVPVKDEDKIVGVVHENSLVREI